MRNIQALLIKKHENCLFSIKVQLRIRTLRGNSVAHQLKATRGQLRNLVRGRDGQVISIGNDEVKKWERESEDVINKNGPEKRGKDTNLVDLDKTSQVYNVGLDHTIVRQDGCATGQET